MTKLKKKTKTERQPIKYKKLVTSFNTMILAK